MRRPYDNYWQKIYDDEILTPQTYPCLLRHHTRTVEIYEERLPLVRQLQRRPAWFLGAREYALDGSVSSQLFSALIRDYFG